MSTTSMQMWCMPPAGFFAKKPEMGELSPSGCRSSSFVLGSSTNTVVTPCSGRSCGSLIFAPNSVLYTSAACRMHVSFGTAMATWFSLPAIGSCAPSENILRPPAVSALRNITFVCVCVGRGREH